MSSDGPIAIENFEISDKCFDAEATANIGEAFDRACQEMHGKPQPAWFQESIAKRLIDIAARGECNAEKCAHQR